MGVWHFRILKIVTRGILEYLKLCLRINGPRMQQLKQLKEMTVRKSRRTLYTSVSTRFARKVAWAQHLRKWFLHSPLRLYFCFREIMISSTVNIFYFSTDVQTSLWYNYFFHLYWIFYSMLWVRQLCGFIFQSITHIAYIWGQTQVCFWGTSHMLDR